MRFTPTRVGSCGCAFDRPFDPAVHPHSRGELVFERLVSAAFIGSPPLAWGVDSRKVIVLTCVRFTPTRVGSWILTNAVVAVSAGSPPLAWGVGRSRLYASATKRFTPTRVGSCGDSSGGYVPCAVHPHSRGELLFKFRRECVELGSPPLAWGVDKGE